MTSMWFYKFFEDGLWNMLEEELTVLHKVWPRTPSIMLQTLFEIPRFIFYIVLSKLFALSV